MRSRSVLSFLTAAVVSVSPIVVPTTVAPVAIAAPSQSYPAYIDNGGDTFLYKLGSEDGSPTCEEASKFHPLYQGVVLVAVRSVAASYGLEKFYPDLSANVDYLLHAGMNDEEKEQAVGYLARHLQQEGFNSGDAQNYAGAIVTNRLNNLNSTDVVSTVPTSDDNSQLKPITQLEAERRARDLDKQIRDSGRVKKSTYYESFVGGAGSLGRFDEIKFMSEVGKQRLWDATRENNFKAYKKVMFRVLNRLTDPSSNIDTSNLTPNAVKYVASVEDRVQTASLSIFSFSLFQESLWFNDRQSFFRAVEAGELTQRLYVPTSYRCVDYLTGNTTDAPIETYNQRMNDAMKRITAMDVWELVFDSSDNSSDNQLTETPAPTPKPAPGEDSQSSSQGNSPIMGIVLVVAALAAVLGFIGAVLAGAAGPLRGVLPQLPSHR